MRPQPFWYKFGTVLDPMDITPLETAKLNWRVEKKPCYATGESQQILTEHFALVKEPGSVYFGTAGKIYKTKQNTEVFNYAKKFYSINEMRMEVAGFALEWVWFLGRSKYRFSLGTGTDPINIYLLMAYPHKCRMGLAISLFLHRPANETCMVYNVKPSRTQFPVIQESEWNVDRVAASREVATAMRQIALDVELKALAMSKARPTDDEVINFYDSLRAREMGSGRITTATANAKLLEFYQYGFGAMENSCTGTWWGAYQAFCYYIDHHVGKKDERRLFSSCLGARGDIKRRALELAYNHSKKLWQETDPRYRQYQ